MDRLETTKRELIREYQELVNDETPVVKQRAIASLLQIMDCIDLGTYNFEHFLRKIVTFDLDTKQSFVIPFFRKHCEDKADVLLPYLVKEFGQFLWLARDGLSEADLRGLMQFYYSSATGPNIDLRKKCANNYPVKRSLFLKKPFFN